jgi:hypothetical protein
MIEESEICPLVKEGVIATAHWLKLLQWSCSLNAPEPVTNLLMIAMGYQRRPINAIDPQRKTASDLRHSPKDEKLVHIEVDLSCGVWP